LYEVLMRAVAGERLLCQNGSRVEAAQRGGRVDAAQNSSRVEAAQKDNMVVAAQKGEIEGNGEVAQESSWLLRTTARGKWLKCAEEGRLLRSAAWQKA
jgi:phage gp45-like